MTREQAFARAFLQAVPIPVLVDGRLTPDGMAWSRGMIETGAAALRSCRWRPWLVVA